MTVDLAEQRVRDQPPRLMREVLSPSVALCDECLDAARQRQRGALVRAIWVSAILVSIAHLLARWSW